MPARGLPAQAGGSASGGKIICIIPAFNEGKTIGEVVRKVKPFVSEIVVVDDCSSDNTFAILKTENATALRHLVNRGQGASLQTGMDYALMQDADVLVHFDADGQFLAEEIRDVLAPIIAGEADVVFGSRFLDKKSEIPKLKKYLIMPLARLVNEVFLGINMSDPQSGFRALSREAALKIKIEQDRMAHCSEILLKVFALKLRVKEVPTSVIYHDFGQRIGGGIKILKELFMGSLIK